MIRAAIILICAALLAGCDPILGTRDVEPPDKQTGGSWQPPTTPEQVLENMEQAVLERNADNYIRCLSDSTQGDRSFRFVPDEETRNVYPGVFDDWDLQEEKRVFREMENSVPTDSILQLVFAEERERVEFTDSARIEVRYTLRAHHTRTEMDREATGRARFTFARNDQRNWVIYRWEDYRDEERMTWSQLKATL